MENMSNKTIAGNRIKKLFNEAEKVFGKNPGLANRYVDLARKIGMKVNVRIPRLLKRKYCKHCYHYLKNGVNGRVRIHKSRVVIYCKDCKKYSRIPLINK